jgi:hypothetical protein
VKQNKEEWSIVMDKLERIAGLIDKVGALCGEHNLSEKDVLRSLRTIFESLVMYVMHFLYTYHWLIVDK